MPLSSGPLSLKLVLDRETGRRAARGLDKAIGAEVKRLTEFLSAAAVRFIRGLEHGLGHDTLAELWTSTPPTPEGTGYAAEIYSRAEGMTFYDKNNAKGGQHDTNYPVPGKKLIEWLEYGVQPHDIIPRDPNGRLAFPIAEGISASDFVGTAQTDEGVVAGSFTGPEANSLLVTEHVHHPGFAGDHVLRATAEFLESEAARQGEAAAQRIATAFVAAPEEGT